METKIIIIEEKKNENPRKSAALFVVQFILITITLLTAYRFLIDSPYNDLYLFTVTKHTVKALDHIGHSTKIQTWPDFKNKEPATKRARLVAWQRGEDQPTPEDIADASADSFTAWERYSYDASFARHNKSRTIPGPSVYFIYKPGAQDLIAEAKEKIAELRQDTLITETQRNSKISDLEAEIKTLTAAHREAAKSTDIPKSDRPARAILQIASECGAIELFAIFFAAVIAFPTAFWKRIIGVIVGIPILYCVNIFRLFCLFVIRALDSEGTVFNFVHEYVWQTVYIVFVVALWLVWMEYLVRRKSS